MKTRSALLVAFMIVVPAVAMFSHRIPPDVRRTIRGQLGRMAAAVTPSTAAPAASPPPPAPASPLPTEPAAVSPPPVAATAATAPPSPPDGAAGGDVADRLARLGAIGFECRPLAGGDGAHVASCSVPLDGSGQLLRVFHVTGGDARSAMTALVDDVTAWRDRAGFRRAAVAPDRAAAEPLRF